MSIVIGYLELESEQMSIGEKGVCVRILEKEFRVACPKNQEQALRDAAHYLDKQMRQISQTGRVIGTERIAVMAALNITNELLNLKHDKSPALEDAFNERIKSLQKKIDNALAPQDVMLQTENVVDETEICALENEVVENEETEPQMA